MGLFDYALNSFSPYQGGLLGALGANDMAALARAYGGYQQSPPDGFETPPAAGVNRARLNMPPGMSENDISQLIAGYPNAPTASGPNRARLQMPQGMSGNDISQLIAGYPNTPQQSGIEPSGVWGGGNFSHAEPSAVWGPPSSGAEPNEAWQKPPAFTIDSLIKRFVTSPMLSGISPLAPQLPASSAPVTPPSFPSLTTPAGAAPINSSGAEPSAAWAGPQTMNTPIPRPRPSGLGQAPQQFSSDRSMFFGDGSQASMGGGAGGGAWAPQQQSAQLPPKAQPIQGQAPPQMQPQMQAPDVGMGDRLIAGANNFSSGGNPIAMLANVAQGLATGRRFDHQGQQQANQAQMAQALYGALIQRGMPHQQAVGIAMAASTDSKMAEHLLPEALGLKPPATVEGVIASDMYRNKGGQPGGSAAGFDAITKLAEAKAKGEKSGGVIGERQAAAEMDLPSAVAQAKEGLRLAGDLRNHKGREGNIWWHGKMGAYLPDSSIPGNTDARDANGILSQIKGGAFLEAFKTLKGGGQITEVEGKKATDAIARMDRSQSRSEFDKALSDYEGVIRLGIDRANQQANKPAPYGFKGNTEWQQVKPGVRIRQVN